MATASGMFKSREELRKQQELDKARKAGLAPPEIDEEGHEINPHIPNYIAKSLWYLNADKPSLKHQRNWKPSSNINTNSWYDRGAKTFQADTYRKGSCENCGAKTHDRKSCTERPRKIGAVLTNKNIAPDEKIESFELSYDGKRDRWNGYESAQYAGVIKRYEARDEARRDFLKEQRLKKLEKKSKKQHGEEEEFSDEEEEDDALKLDEAKVDESKQTDFAKVEKRVRTTGGGSTGTVRNLRIREDTAKYLLNLDVNSAHYDPKTRSMLEDPLPNADPNEKFYAGDNQYRMTGKALEFKRLKVHAWESSEKGQEEINMQAAPSQAELVFKIHMEAKENLKEHIKESIMEKYGNAASEEEILMELLLGQSEKEVEYDRCGRVIKGMESSIPKSKYEEDVVYTNNHTSVWGSWWNNHQWGYECCQQTIKKSYCTGFAGNKAGEEASELMQTNIQRQAASNEMSGLVEKKRLAAWGSEIPQDLVLDGNKLAEALKKEDERKTEVKDERKRKYNVHRDDQVTPEEMEAYRMKRMLVDDPMKNLLH